MEESKKIKKGIFHNPDIFNVNEKDVDEFDEEFEYKEKKVLDFLANLQRDKEFVVKIMHPYSFSDCIFIPIQIVKYSENKYRIVEHEIY